MILPHA